MASNSSVEDTPYCTESGCRRRGEVTEPVAMVGSVPLELWVCHRHANEAHRFERREELRLQWSFYGIVLAACVMLPLVIWVVCTVMRYQ